MLVKPLAVLHPGVCCKDPCPLFVFYPISFFLGLHHLTASGLYISMPQRGTRRFFALMFFPAAFRSYVLSSDSDGFSALDGCQIMPPNKEWPPFVLFFPGPDPHCTGCLFVRACHWGRECGLVIPLLFRMRERSRPLLFAASFATWAPHFLCSTHCRPRPSHSVVQHTPCAQKIYFPSLPSLLGGKLLRPPNKYDRLHRPCSRRVSTNHTALSILSPSIRWKRFTKNNCFFA